MSPSDTRPARWFPALGLVLVFSLAVLLGSFHHHHDLQDHPDCAICAVAHQAPAAAAVVVPQGVALASLPLAKLPPIPVVLAVESAAPLRSRAPPA